LFVIPLTADAQISYNPVSMGLGGGGTSYITGYDALFINPANIQLREKNYRVQFSFAEIGVYHDTPLRIRNVGDRFNSYSDQFNIPGSNDYLLSNEGRESLLSRHYPSNRLNRQFRSTSAIHWFGIKWFRDERSYALSVRTRQSNRYTVGRGWYDENPVETDNGLEIDQMLSHSFQTLHEISFGYSESFSFLSGLLPRISRFNIGIAPKIVLSGPAYSTRFSDHYTRSEDGQPWVRESSYSFESSGKFSSHAQQLAFGNTSLPSEERLFSQSDLFQPSGIGAAIDLGITYLFTFGDDLSLIRRTEEATEKSLRLSFSVTDLGIIHYFDDPFRTDISSTVSDMETPGSVSNHLYSGAVLQDFQFLTFDGVHPLQQNGNQNQDSFSSMLPTSIQSGILFQINRIKLMGDFKLGLHDDAFQSTKLKSFIGAEVRPLSFLPLRAGTRLATELPGYYSFGAGLETTYFDINAAVQFRSTAAGPTLEPVAASAVAIKFYIP